jgi:hypothetical protein
MTFDQWLAMTPAQWQWSHYAFLILVVAFSARRWL